jgi:hypothetical protein
MYGRNRDLLSRKFSCRRQAVSITYSEFVPVTLVIQHAMRMRRIISLCAACPAVQYFSHYLIKGKNLEDECAKGKMCFDCAYNFCLRHFSF